MLYAYKDKGWPQLAIPVYAFEGCHISLIHGVDQQIHPSFGTGNQAAYQADRNSTVVQTWTDPNGDVF